MITCRYDIDNLQAYKSWDPNNYASIPGWGGNAKYYNQLLKSDKTEEKVEEINNRVFADKDSKRQTGFAAIATNNILS